MTDIPQKEEQLLRAYLPSGNFPAAYLQRLLDQYTHVHSALVAAPQRKTVSIALADRLLILSTHATARFAADLGHYAVHLGANEVACMGGAPKWFMTTVLLPERNAGASAVEQIYAQISSQCRGLDITWCGGQVELTPAVAQPVVFGAMLGEGLPAPDAGSPHIVPGDHVLLAKELSIAGTALVGTTQAKALTDAFDENFGEQCRLYLHTPGLSVLQAAKIAWRVPRVHALRAPAERGLATALHELLVEQNLGVEIDEGKLPLAPETKLLCEHFGLDPLGLSAAGALLIVGEAGACEQAMLQYETAAIPSALIGQILPEAEGRWVREEGNRRNLPTFARDEFCRMEAFDQK